MASGQQTSIPFTPAVVHPGEIVSEYIEFHGWTQRDLARRTGLTPKTISEILNGKAPVMPATALALEKVLRRPAHFWLTSNASMTKRKRAVVSFENGPNGRAGLGSSQSRR